MTIDSIVKAISESAAKNASVAPQLLYAPILWGLQDAIASGELVPANADKSWSSDQFWQFVEGLAGDFEAKQMRDELTERGLAIIPASAVAAERERCAKVCDERAVKLRAKAKSMKQPHSQQYFGQAIEARVIAEALRALEPASGEYVLVPREPTMGMMEAAQQAWFNDPLKRSSTLYRAMIAAATSNGSGK